jgi:hypothetical protein
MKEEGLLSSILFQSGPSNAAFCAFSCFAFREFHFIVKVRDLNRRKKIIIWDS